jgi:hypothetical protein
MHAGRSRSYAIGGMIFTNRLRADEALGQAPQRRWLVAWAIQPRSQLLLRSRDASDVTGTRLVVDGGWTARRDSAQPAASDAANPRTETALTSTRPPGTSRTSVQGN